MMEPSRLPPEILDRMHVKDGFVTVVDIQHYLDFKFGRGNCFAFGTTGMIPNAPDWLIPKKTKLHTIPFKSYVGWFNDTIMFHSIMYLQDENAEPVDFSDFTNFIAYPSAPLPVIINAQPISW